MYPSSSYSAQQHPAPQQSRQQTAQPMHRRIAFAPQPSVDADWAMADDDDLAMMQTAGRLGLMPQHMPMQMPPPEMELPRRPHLPQPQPQRGPAAGLRVKLDPAAAAASAHSGPSAVTPRGRHDKLRMQSDQRLDDQSKKPRRAAALSEKELHASLQQRIQQATEQYTTMMIRRMQQEKQISSLEKRMRVIKDKLEEVEQEQIEDRLPPPSVHPDALNAYEQTIDYFDRLDIKDEINGLPQNLDRQFMRQKIEAIEPVAKANRVIDTFQTVWSESVVMHRWAANQRDKIKKRREEAEWEKVAEMVDRMREVEESRRLEEEAAAIARGDFDRKWTPDEQAQIDHARRFKKDLEQMRLARMEQEKILAAKESQLVAMHQPVVDSVEKWHRLQAQLNQANSELEQERVEWGKAKRKQDEKIRQQEAARRRQMENPNNEIDSEDDDEGEAEFAPGRGIGAGRSSTAQRSNSRQSNTSAGRKRKQKTHSATLPSKRALTSRSSSDDDDDDFDLGLPSTAGHSAKKAAFIRKSVVAQSKIQSLHPSGHRQQQQQQQQATQMGMDDDEDDSSFDPPSALARAAAAHRAQLQVRSATGTPAAAARSGSAASHGQRPQGRNQRPLKTYTSEVSAWL